MGFAMAINAVLEGRSLTCYEFVVLLNDDVVVTPRWLTGMVQGFPCFPAVGMVGPVSNEAIEAQKVDDIPPTLIVASDENLYKYAQDFKALNTDIKPFVTGFISGFCMMISREVLQQTGFLDERFGLGGFEDNDLCLRALDLGYISVVVPNVFVWHSGHITINRFPEMRHGLANRHLFYKKWHNPEVRKKLCVLYRVRDDAYNFSCSLRRTLEFTDFVAVLDDGSEILPNSKKSAIQITCEDLDQGTNQIVYYRQEKDSSNERDDRNRLIQMGKETGADWGLFLDSDEIIENSFTQEYVQRIMNSPDPGARAFGFNWYTFWDDNNWRADGIFGNMFGFRMFKLSEGQSIIRGTEQGLHCGNLPELGPNTKKMTSIRIKHLGYDTDEIRQRKFEWYENFDQDRTPELVGGESYRHLIDKRGVELKPWIEENDIGLFMIVRNEEDQLHEALSEVHQFFTQLVIVDTGSTDATKEIASMYTDEVYEFEKFDPELPDFSAVRNFALSKMTTRWVMFLDADERITGSLLVSLRRSLSESLYDAFGFQIYNRFKNMDVPIVTEAVRLFYNREGLEFKNKVHETITESIQQIPDFRIGTAPIPIYHLGYLRNPERIKAKHKAYEKVLRQEDSALADFSLAMSKLEDSNFDAKEIEALLEKAIQKEPNFYQAKRELAYMYLRLSAANFLMISQKLKPEHPFVVVAKKYLNTLSKMIPPIPRSI